MFILKLFPGGPESIINPYHISIGVYDLACCFFRDFEGRDVCLGCFTKSQVAYILEAYMANP